MEQLTVMLHGENSGDPNVTLTSDYFSSMKKQEELLKLLIVVTSWLWVVTMRNRMSRKRPFKISHQMK